MDLAGSQDTHPELLYTTAVFNEAVMSFPILVTTFRSSDKFRQNLNGSISVVRLLLACSG